MRIGVLGAGRVGGALAETWRAAGHDVRVSTRETVRETAADREVLLLAVPAGAAPDVLAAAGDLEGRVLVDATNNLSGGPAGLAIAALVPGARVVKAFNTVFATYFHDTPPARPATLMLCGDDAGAKETAARLARDAGFDPIDAGGAEKTPLVEAFAQLVIGLAYEQGRGTFVYRFEAE
jgi:8-hydroxy-5-deazaflavin:NADPH oxidoreductase